MSKCSIIGIGNFGTKTALRFSKYSEYNIFTFSNNKEEHRSHFCIPKYENPEDYERREYKLSTFFRGIRRNIIVILDGSELIASAILSILEKIQDKNITILYIKPDLTFLSNLRTLQERVASGVLQNYARSNLFEQIIMFDLNRIDEVIGNVPITQYDESVIELIVSTYHMLNIFNNSKSIIDNYSNFLDILKIATLGIVNFETGEEKSFFSLDTPREKRYYYAINREKLETDNYLFQHIKKQIKSKAEESVKVSYGVFPTEYENDYVYVLTKTNIVQE